MLAVFISLVIGLGIGILIMMSMKKSQTGVKPSSSIFGIKYARGTSDLIDGIDNIENKIWPIVQGAMCNVLHDPSLMNMIPKSGAAKCSDILNRVESEMANLEKLLGGIVSETPDDITDVQRVQVILYEELVTLQEKLTAKYCSSEEKEIDAATMTKIIEDVRNAVCADFEITPTTFKTYVENVSTEAIAFGQDVLKSKSVTSTKLPRSAKK
jgi:acetylglutamate synthase|tara:strand:- start:131 stop:766 length:636 start_codon:yes stop_codon:yes gene_type:complete